MSVLFSLRKTTGVEPVGNRALGGFSIGSTPSSFARRSNAAGLIWPSVECRRPECLLGTGVCRGQPPSSARSARSRRPARAGQPRARRHRGTLAPTEVIQAQSEAAARRGQVALAQQVLREAELTLKRLIVDGTEDDLWSADLIPTVLLQRLGSRARVRWVDLATRPIRTPCGSAASDRPRRPSPSTAPVPCGAHASSRYRGRSTTPW